MRTVIKNVKLNGELTDIITEGDKIAFIGKTEESGIDMGGIEAYPGLIDIHSHGAVGLDTMECNLERIAEYELSCGITTWYPTTVTMSAEDIIAATHAKTEFPNGANIPGFHIEGPFINVKYKGAQNEKYIIPPSAELWAKLKRAKLITVAPEIPGVLEFIEACDAVVCLGHTAADYDTAAEAFNRGARCLTHTFNAMPGIHHRAPSVIGAAQDAGAYAQLISDGLHIHPSAVRMAVKLFGEDNIILISDSIAATGLSDGVYSFGGQDITVKGGVALTSEGAISGSTTNLFECVKRAISFGIPKAAAVKMATENPARLMGINKGKLAAGYDADIIFVDGNFDLKAVMIRGKMRQKCK